MKPCREGGTRGNVGMGGNDLMTASVGHGKINKGWQERRTEERILPLITLLPAADLEGFLAQLHRLFLNYTSAV